MLWSYPIQTEIFHVVSSKMASRLGYCRAIQCGIRSSQPSIPSSTRPPLSCRGEGLILDFSRLKLNRHSERKLIAQCSSSIPTVPETDSLTQATPPITDGMGRLSDRDDNAHAVIFSNAQNSHNIISLDIEENRSKITHATTSDFIPPPSLQEGVHVATNNRIISSGRSYRSPRMIKIRRKNSPSRKSESVRDSETLIDYREPLDGYKYRILKTPQLTNDQLPSPVPDLESPPIHPPTATPSHENEDYDFYNIQRDTLAPSSVQSLPLLPNGVNDVLSSNWWRTLYQNIGKSPTNISSASTHPFQSASMRNRRSSLLLEEVFNTNTQNIQEEEKDTARIRVRSIQAASSIDVVAVLSKVFGGGVARASQYDLCLEGESINGKAVTNRQIQNPLAEFFASSPPLRHVFGRTNIIIQLSPPPLDCPPSLAPSVPRYVAIYRFGSVVFFNVTTKEASKLLEQIKKHSVDPIAVGFERREFFEMGLQPQLETAIGRITADRAMVKELDMNTVGVVSNIMGQTVALDWHNDTVDELLANFSNINSSVEKTGSFTSMERHMLFQVVARNNSLFIDMVAKLGIKDRSDTAWHLSQYEGLHYGMREQFDLDERFRHIEFKLDLIQQNAKFFLEVLHAQKSNTLEWVIVALISFECVLMCLDMSGLGAKFFAGFAYFQ